MSLLKNKVFVVFITLAILASGLAFAQTASAITLGELVELFIALGVIAPDKIDAARSIIEKESQPTSSCLSLSYNHYLGRSDSETNGEVSKLQNYLKQTGDYTYPEITGYFGPSTERAVQSWQSKKGVVSSGTPDSTGYGVVGPQTREVMGCGSTIVQPYKPKVCPQVFPPVCENGVLVGNGKDANGCNLGYVCEEVSLFVDGITVTAPNGGEQWEIGQLNTITWAPYDPNSQINHSKDVTVFLEIKTGKDQYVQVGRIMDTGKASLHTYFNINYYDVFADPGEFYVRVLNNVTGESDRSDMPFTLLPRGVDIKVNGSDGPVTLVDNQKVTVIVNPGANFASCTLSGVRPNPGASPGISLGGAVAGVPSTSEGFAYVPASGSATSIYIKCTKSDGSTRSDGVQVNFGGTTASLQVTSPNGGENITFNESTFIRFRQTGIKSYSIALYENDQWKGWIVKDWDVKQNSEDIGFYWNPPGIEPELTSGSAIYKIYITGQKSDGTGYVDDKSDAPFGFSIVGNAPFITDFPYDRGVSIPIGASRVFSVTATGDGLKYQWQKQDGSTWTNIPGAVSYQLNLSNVTTSQAGRYRVQVSNTAGTVSGSFNLTVGIGPVITVQPKGISVPPGSSPVFSVTATGDGLKYQWQKQNGSTGSRWTSIPGAVSYRFGLSKITVSNAGRYRVVVSNAGGTMISSTFTVIVGNLPVIKTQPKGISVPPGSSPVFSVTATGDGLKYQWQKLNNGAWRSIPGAVSYRFGLGNIQTSNAGRYRVVVSNTIGSVNSNPFTVTVTVTVEANQQAAVVTAFLELLKSLGVETGI
jgi:hypothetical protein